VKQKKDYDEPIAIAPVHSKLKKKVTYFTINFFPFYFFSPAGQNYLFNVMSVSDTTEKPLNHFALITTLSLRADSNMVTHNR